MTLKMYRVQADCTWDEGYRSDYYMATDQYNAMDQFKADWKETEGETFDEDDWSIWVEAVPSPEQRQGKVPTPRSEW